MITMATIQLVFIAAFVAIVGSKNIPKTPLTGDDALHVKRCMCDIRLNNAQGTVVHDFGVIQRHLNYPPGACHRLRQNCKRICDQKARNLTELNQVGPLHGHVEGFQFGYKTCIENYKELLGRKGQTLVAVSHTPGCQHHENHLHVGHWKEPICCGLTLLVLEDGKAARVVGWNPDCAYNEYIIA